MPHYVYVTMKLTDVLDLTMLPGTPQPDAYLSDDLTANTYRALIAAGYRWLRTDGDYAIFEKEQHHASSSQVPPSAPRSAARPALRHAHTRR